MLDCNPILRLHSLWLIWRTSLLNEILHTGDCNGLIIPTITMGRQQAVATVQLWLWADRAKLAVQGLFQSLIIHCKFSKEAKYQVR